MVEADEGYIGEDKKIMTPNHPGATLLRQIISSTARRRHETANKRFKQFGVLSGCFCHDYWLAERRKGDLVVTIHLKAKRGHPWLAERCKENLVVKCHLKPNSGHPWLGERRKGDLGVKGLFDGK